MSIREKCLVALLCAIVAAIGVSAYVDSQKGERRWLCNRGYAPDLCAEFGGVR